MADEPSDVCSRMDGDGANTNNKRKISQACSYPNKKGGFVIRNGRELFVTGALAVVVSMVVYVFTEGQLAEEGDLEEADVEEEEEQEDEDEDEDEDEEEDEGDDEEHEDEANDDNARINLLEVAVDCFIATKAWAGKTGSSEGKTLP